MEGVAWFCWKKEDGPTPETEECNNLLSAPKE